MAYESINFTRIEVKSNYIHAFDFEVYDLLTTLDLIVKFRPFMFAIISFYLIGIYFGQKWMKNRQPYKLESALFFWNVGLGLFSIVATIRGFPEAAFLLQQPNGMYLAICTWETHNYATSFWMILSLLSKVVELGDTAFIILRKQKLIVLHWFHHLSTLMGCWLGFEKYDAVARFFIVNTFVHSFMYPYYAMKVLKIKIPRKLSMALTALQILQMVYFLYLTCLTLYFKLGGLPCQLHVNSIYMCCTIIPAFLFLFVNFFRNTYLKRDKVKAQ